MATVVICDRCKTPESVKAGSHGYDLCAECAMLILGEFPREDVQRHIGITAASGKPTERTNPRLAKIHELTAEHGRQIYCVPLKEGEPKKQLMWGKEGKKQLIELIEPWEDGLWFAKVVSDSVSA